MFLSLLSPRRLALTAGLFASCTLALAACGSQPIDEAGESQSLGVDAEKEGAPSGDEASPDKPEPCAKMDAFGEGGCDLWLGVKYNGDECEVVNGCVCNGADCDWLYPSPDDCEKANLDCEPSDPPPPTDGCSALGAKVNAALEAARACNLLSANAALPCQTTVPTITGCGAPVAFPDSDATKAYLALLELYLAKGCPVGEQPCFDVELPGQCVPGKEDVWGRCESAEKPTDS